MKSVGSMDTTPDAPTAASTNHPAPHAALGDWDQLALAPADLTHEFVDLPHLEEIHRLSHIEVSRLQELWGASGAMVWELQATLSQVVAQVMDLEREHGPIDRQLLRRALEPLRWLLRKSPFVRRIQAWPRGYPGDFETVEMLLNGASLEASGRWGAAIDQMALASPIVLQHHFKIRRQAEMVMQVSRTRRGAARILVIASGGARDLLSIASHLRHSRDRVVLNDVDEDALTLAAERLRFLGDRLTVVKGNALKMRKSLALNGPYDLVMAGGLYDYLDAREASSLTRMIGRTLLEHDGTFFFTNIRKHHPFKIWMEGMCSWDLVERDADECAELVEKAGLQPTEVTLDPTGLAYLIEARATRG